MPRRWFAVVPLLFALLAATACSGDDPPAPAGPTALFDPAAEWGKAPFPSDLYRDDDGTVALPALPNDTPLWGDVAALLNARSGFCSSCTVHFPIDGAVDRTSLGDDPAVGSEASPQDPLVMVDVERGELVPLRREYDDTESLVTVRPVRGAILRPGARYATALTGAVRGSDGAPVQPAPILAEALAGRGDPALVELIAEGRAALEAAGVDGGAIASLTVFTTGEPIAHVTSIHSLLDEELSASPPAASLESSWRADDGTLDELLGVPAPGKPGLDAEPAPGVEGDKAVAHQTTAFLVAGSFPAPRIVQGAGAEVGALRRDAAGELELGPSEDVTFVLTIPEGADVTNLPLAVVHWGVGGRRQNALVFADTLGELGIAVLGIDAFQHGARADSATDTAHDMRGGDDFLGPDGLDEHSSVGVTSRMFGIAGVDDALAASPRFSLASLSQLAADAYAAVRFARSGDLSALEAVDPALAGMRFDPDHLYFIGESLGTIAATATLAGDSGVAAAVLGVAPGSLIDIFCEAPVYRSTVEVLFLPLLDIEGDFDELDRHLCMSPMLNLYRWALEPLEPQALARHLFLEPVASGPRPDVMWTFGDRDESVGTAVPDALVAALGIPAVGSFAFADVAPGEPPFEANVETPAGPVTAGAWRHSGAGHGMLGQRAQSASVEPPVVPPFVPLPTTEKFENPTDATHAQIAAFFAAHLAAGRAKIAAP